MPRSYEPRPWPTCIGAAALLLVGCAAQRPSPVAASYERTYTTYERTERGVQATIWHEQVTFDGSTGLQTLTSLPDGIERHATMARRGRGLSRTTDGVGVDEVWLPRRPRDGERFLRGEWAGGHPQWCVVAASASCADGFDVQCEHAGDRLTQSFCPNQPPSLPSTTQNRGRSRRQLSWSVDGSILEAQPPIDSSAFSERYCDTPPLSPLLVVDLAQAPVDMAAARHQPMISIHEGPFLGWRPYPDTASLMEEVGKGLTSRRGGVAHWDALVVAIDAHEPADRWVPVLQSILEAEPPVLQIAVEVDPTRDLSDTTAAAPLLSKIEQRPAQVLPILDASFAHTTAGHCPEMEHAFHEVVYGTDRCRQSALLVDALYRACPAVAPALATHLELAAQGPVQAGVFEVAWRHDGEALPIDRDATFGSVLPLLHRRRGDVLRPTLADADLSEDAPEATAPEAMPGLGDPDVRIAQDCAGTWRVLTDAALPAAAGPLAQPPTGVPWVVVTDHIRVDGEQVDHAAALSLSLEAKYQVARRYRRPGSSSVMLVLHPRLPATRWVPLVHAAWEAGSDDVWVLAAAGEGQQDIADNCAEGPTPSDRPGAPVGAFLLRYDPTAPAWPVREAETFEETIEALQALDGSPIFLSLR